MNEADPSALYVLAGSLITGILAFIIQFMNTRTAAKKEERAGQMAMDAAAFARVTDVQTMQQNQLNRQDVTIRELQKSLSEATAEILVLKRKLEEAEKAGDPLKKEIDDLRKQVTELQETIATLQATIEGLQSTIDTLQATIEELRAQIPEQGSTGEK